MCRLVYSGVMEAHPRLPVLTHHAGAMIPFFSGRFRIMQTEDQGQALERLPHEPLQYLRRFYADTAVFGAPQALRCAVDFFGPEHVLFGTDMPLGGPTVVADTIADVESLGLAAADRERIYSGNAREVLRLGS
jgi:predicted TIM-barrel fold metal-dependent hydrolase